MRKKSKAELRNQPNPRNQPCFCGSGMKYKDCCERLNKDVQDHLRKFDLRINEEIAAIVERLNINEKGLVISRRPSDCFELGKIYYIKGKYDLLKATSPALPVIKTRQDLASIFNIPLDAMVIEDLSLGYKVEIQVKIKDTIVVADAKNLKSE